MAENGDMWDNFSSFLPKIQPFSNTLKELKKFQVNSKLMSLAKKNAIFLHCLPASIGKEVTKQVMYGKKSKVYSQAENRISSVKSVIEYCLK